ncbi:MAG: hypothetical protein ABI639_07355 [Thermoanaerobaculia bacterium]
MVEKPPEGTESLWIAVGPGRYAAPYAIGQSLLFIPFDMASYLLERYSSQPLKEHLPWLPIGLGLLPLLGVGYWLALRRLLQVWGLPHPWPTIGALVVMLGSMMFFYAGQAQEETLVALCLTLATTCALNLRRSATWKNALGAGLFAGACLTIRPVSLFALLVVPPLLISLRTTWSIRLRLLAVAALGVAAVNSISLLHNVARFGSAFTIGYERMGHFSKLAIDLRWPQTLLSLLFGPGGGLLVLSPVLLLSFAGWRRLWQSDRAYAIGLLASLVSCYSFFSGWHDSHTGGSTWGTRYEAHLLGLFAIPVTIGLKRLAESSRGSKLAIVILSISVGIQGLSVFATHHLEPFQTSCDGAGEARLLNSPLEGQLALRVKNVARWALGKGPPSVGNPGCLPTMATIWDRYVPNFWGPVYAHRLGASGNWVMVAWSLIGLTALAALATGLRKVLQPLYRASKPGDGGTAGSRLM